MLIDGINMTPSALGTANGVASLGDDSKIVSTQLPAIAITDTFIVAGQSEMLAVSAETGDVAVRTDLSKSFILKGTSASTLSDWTELLSPVPVTTYDVAFSVYGKPANAENVMRFIVPRALVLAANLQGSLAKAGIAGTASSVFSIKKNGSQVATITFSAGATSGTFSTQASLSLASGDVLTVDAQATADATLANIDFTFVGTI